MSLDRGVISGLFFILFPHIHFIYWIHILNAILTSKKVLFYVKSMLRKGSCFPIDFIFAFFIPLFCSSCVILQLVAPGCGYHYDIGICLLLNHTVYN